jgi:tetratricopeptide (TPR) repeat protein
VLTSDRLTKLQAMLQRQPDDPFLLYGIAMEHKKLGQTDLALEYLGQTLAVDPAYCYAHYQTGQVREMTGDTEGARRAYHAGIEAANRAGDQHAKSELETALADME